MNIPQQSLSKVPHLAFSSPQVERRLSQIEKWIVVGFFPGCCLSQVKSFELIDFNSSGQPQEVRQQQIKSEEIN